MTSLNSQEAVVKEQASPPSIWTLNFSLLIAANFLIFSNIAVFFDFYGHLKTLPIDPARFGLLIGCYSAVSLIFRPMISPLLNSGNARPFIYIGITMVMGSLALYSLSSGFWSILLVRSFHGLAFVVLGSATMAVLVDNIPPKRSSQAFGIVGIVVMLPTTVIPPLFPVLQEALGGFNRVLLAFAGVTALSIPLVLFMRKKGEGEDGSAGPGRLRRHEIINNFRDTRILLIFLSMLMLYLGNALIFFFIAAYAAGLGVSGAGLFFTASTLAELGIRAAAGSSFDKMKKNRLIAGTMAGLALGYAILAIGGHSLMFFGVMGAFIGLGWGIALPVFNGLVFDISAPKYRALNTNLGFQMYQLGYFVGPIIGGYMAQTWGFSIMFLFCAGMSVIGAGVACFVKTD